MAPRVGHKGVDEAASGGEGIDEGSTPPHRNATTVTTLGQPKLDDETATDLLLRLTGKDLLCCPKCDKGRMERTPLPELDARAPPRWAA